jgi:murein L,D-transpeptidase YafK
MKYGFLSFFCFYMVSVFAQPSFFDIQRSFPRVAQASKTKLDTLKKQVEQVGLEWPLAQIYIRSFKYDSQLEVWGRNNSKEVFKLVKTYKICALSGALGPKRIEGDYQVPEGFYEIDAFKPRSNYHLSLGINYPNNSDMLLSDSVKPGKDIFIHGTCITVGCIPLMNEIEELYLLAAQAKSQGQDFIPVHIFPVRFNRQKSVDFLTGYTKNDTDYLHFTKQLKQVFDYFEKHKKLPLILINQRGEYVLNN